MEVCLMENAAGDERCRRIHPHILKSETIICIPDEHRLIPILAGGHIVYNAHEGIYMYQLINGNTMTAKELQTKTIQTEIPIGLLTQAQDLVEAGWFRNLDDLVLDALRRFLESHRGELMEEFIRQDVEWGLTGNE